MDRREFFAAVAGSLAAPLGVEAQQAAKVYRIGAQRRRPMDVSWAKALNDRGPEIE